MIRSLIADLSARVFIWASRNGKGYHWKVTLDQSNHVIDVTMTKQRRITCSPIHYQGTTSLQ